MCANSLNTVVDPLSNKTTYQFANYQGANCNLYSVVESHRQIYQGSSTLLRTVQTQYVGSTGTYPSIQITILPNGLKSQIQWDYWCPGCTDFVKEKREYGWGNGAVGGLARKTGYGQNYCYDKPPSETVYDGSGNQITNTTYEFDNYTAGLSSSGAVQHGSSLNPTYPHRCDITAINRWRNTDGATLTTRMQYDDAGNVVSSTDPNSNTTSFGYADNFTDGINHNSAAFVTQTTYPSTNSVSHIEKKQYFYYTGVPAASCGQNFSGACTNTATLRQPDYATTSYDLMNRPVTMTVGDGGQISTCYSEISGSSCYNSSYPLKVVATQKITSSLNKISTAVLDGLARVTQTQLNSDPDGITYTDTTYDSVERKATVSNPYRSTSDNTYGITTYNYDALSRVGKVIPPDGTSTTNNVSTLYDQLPVNGSPLNNCTIVTDQIGNQRRSCSDALGRLMEVDEPGTVIPGTPGTGAVTISGSERTTTIWHPCGPNGQTCPTTVPDNGNVSITVNGVTATFAYGQGLANDTSASVAAALASAINGNSSYPATASVSGSVITLNAKTIGAVTNYSLTTSSVTTNTTYFTSTSFPATPSGSTLTGGADTHLGTGFPSINSPQVTFYQYDVLNNLLRVDQKGTAPSDSTQWRTRTFTYNSLSQLLCAANPEIAITSCPTPDNGTYTAGTVRYAY
ncbi:MAG TPA: hypothetical protein VGA01_11715, partial [Candidatus Binatia bacterium]